MKAFSTKTLLTYGIVAGPFFILSSFFHGLLREGFDLVRHPASLLSLGEYGWVQIGTFVLTGLLYIASAFGLKRILKSGIGSRFIFPLFIILGLAFISGGVFTADPALGFPPGAPLGVPEVISTHGMIHGFAPIVGSLALCAALIILGRRLGTKDPKWLWKSIVVAIATFILCSMPNFTADFEKREFNFIPLWLGVALGYGYTSVLLMKIKKSL